MLEDLHTTIVAIEKSSLKWGIHFDIARKEEKIAELEYKMGEPTFGTIQTKPKKSLKN